MLRDNTEGYTKITFCYAIARKVSSIKELKVHQATL